MSRALATRLFIISLVLTLGSIVAVWFIDLRLRGPSSTMGIVSFELCAYGDACSAVLQGWSPRAQLWAALTLGVDYLFMLLYSASIFLALWLLADRFTGAWQRVTSWLAWVTWGAGIADACENYCLLRLLFTPEASEYAWPAAVFATIKFTIVGVALLWALVAWLRWVFGSKQLTPA